MRIPPAAIAACLAASSLILLLRPAAASAEQSATETRLREALRQKSAQLQAAEDDRARLQASKAALETELEATKAELAKRAAPKASPREVGALNAKLAEAREQLAAQTAEGKKLGDALAQCEATRQDATRGQDGARAELKAAQEKLGAAEAKNARMYEVGKSIIDWLDRKGFGSALAAREPFLGLKRVELENAAQDYQDKLVEQRIQP